MAKKKRKSVLPKRIAGVKVPKSVRKGPLGQLLASRTGQALLAEAIMAAGAVGVAKQASASSETDKDPPLIRGVVADAFRRWQGGDQHGDQDAMAATIAYAVGEAARAFVRTVNEHRAAAHVESDAAPEPESAAEWRAANAEAGGSKKNFSSQAPGRP